MWYQKTIKKGQEMIFKKMSVHCTCCINRRDSVLVLCSFYWFRKDSSLVSEENTWFVSFSVHLNPRCVFTVSGNRLLVFFFTLRAGIGYDKAQLFPQLTGYVFGFNWAPFSSAQMESTWKKPCTWIWSATETPTFTEPEDWEERCLSF